MPIKASIFSQICKNNYRKLIKMQFPASFKIYYDQFSNNMSILAFEVSTFSFFFPFEADGSEFLPFDVLLVIM